jgi:hypothetical protein
MSGEGSQHDPRPASGLPRISNASHQRAYGGSVRFPICMLVDEAEKAVDGSSGEVDQALTSLSP